jgi:hypothetical protein
MIRKPDHHRSQKITLTLTHDAFAHLDRATFICYIVLTLEARFLM